MAVAAALAQLRRLVEFSCDAADPVRRDASLVFVSQLSLHSRRVSPAATGNDGQQPTDFFAVYLDDFNQAELVHISELASATEIPTATAA